MATDPYSCSWEYTGLNAVDNSLSLVHQVMKQWPSSGVFVLLWDRVLLCSLSDCNFKTTPLGCFPQRTFQILYQTKWHSPSFSLQMSLHLSYLYFFLSASTESSCPWKQEVGVENSTKCLELTEGWHKTVNWYWLAYVLQLRVTAGLQHVYTHPVEPQAPLLASYFNSICKAAQCGLL